jgi:calcium-binding protein CML
MSHLTILSFKYNLDKLRFKSGVRPTGRLLSSRDRQYSDLSNYKPDDEPAWPDLQEGPPGDAGEIGEGNKDGFMGLDEFMEVHKSGVQLGDIRRAFFVFDKDKDGKISAEEVMAVLHKLGDSCSLEDCRKMVKEVDRNDDGFVDMDEFMTMMTRPRRKL